MIRNHKQNPEGDRDVFKYAIIMFADHSGRAIAQAVSRRLPTAAARVQTRVWSCGIL
jgi:hypothetical protein